ncbi:MAG: hypothetical protein WBB64_07320 [Anaerolineales bacterium]
MKGITKIYIMIFVLKLSVISFICCATTPMENLYEPGTNIPLVTIAYQSQQKVEVTRSYMGSVKLQYNINRPIESFISSLHPSGKIECNVNIANLLGSGEGGLHDYPLWGAALQFDLEGLEETGFIEPTLRHSKRDFKSPVHGTVRYYVIAKYVDQNGQKHKGRISNDLVIPAIFYDRD